MWRKSKRKLRKTNSFKRGSGKKVEQIKSNSGNQGLDNTQKTDKGVDNTQETDGGSFDIREAEGKVNPYTGDVFSKIKRKILNHLPIQERLVMSIFQK